MEPVETTLSGNRLWIVVGILGFIGVLISVAMCIPELRPYVDSTIKLISPFIPMIAK